MSVGSLNLLALLVAFDLNLFLEIEKTRTDKLQNLSKQCNSYFYLECRGCPP